MNWPLPRDGVESVVTIGKFDGVHIGHQAVLRTLREKSDGRRVVVVTFDRHPLELFDPSRAPRPLLSIPQKVEALRNAGADLVVVLPFTKEFSQMSPADFVQDVLLDGLTTRMILVGADFRFGSGGAGTVNTLDEMGPSLGFSVEVLKDVCLEGGVKVSSSTIRDALAAGDVETATQLLGRPHRVRGTGTMACRASAASKSAESLYNSLLSAGQTVSSKPVAI